MKLRLLLPFLLLVGPLVLAEDVKPPKVVPPKPAKVEPAKQKIRLPKAAVVVPPKVTPVLPPKPIVPPKAPEWNLKAGVTLYVFEADEPVHVFDEPEGFVKVTEAKIAPNSSLMINGVFVDGEGKRETRTYTGPYVYTVEGTNAGKTCLLLVPTTVAKKEDVKKERLVVLGDKPPPVDPIVPPDVVPPPEPKDEAPIKEPGFRVLMVFANNTARPESQKSVIYGETVRKFLEEKCVSGPDGQKEYRIYPASTDVSEEAKLWQDAFKLPRTGDDWIVISNGKTGYKGPLPANPSDALTLLKKYAN